MQVDEENNQHANPKSTISSQNSSTVTIPKGQHNSAKS
jgi:hypothetical protein